MSPSRSLLLSVFLISASFGSVCAQRRWERVPPPRDPQFYAPRNALEEFEARVDTVLIKGRTYVATLRAQNGTARVEATEIRDARNQSRITGVVITLITPGPAAVDNEVRSLIDYEELDALIRAFDAIAKTDESVTKLTHFEARYRTRGDFEILVFKQVSGGVAAAVEGGFFERTRLFLTLDDFTKLRWMVAQAKERLDEIK
jgi:hypothetical protein